MLVPLLERMTRVLTARRTYRLALALAAAVTAVVAATVGIYQRTFGEQAEEACRRDHVDDVRAVFGWAFGASPTPGSDYDRAISDIGGWPTTCVELNDIVERHLGNDHNVGIYQRAWQDRAERGCQLDHRELANEYPVLGAFLLDLPWLADYVYPWLTDGVSQDEVDFLSTLRPTAEVNEALAMFIASTAWFRNGIDDSDDFRNEEFAPELLRNIYQTSPQYLDIATTYYWVSDDITARELSALKGINELAKRDHDLALRIAGAPWVRDGVRPFEIYTLDSLPILYDSNPSLTRQLADYATTDFVWASDIRLIDIMTNLFTNYGDDDQPRESSRYHRLATQPWFDDGLDAEERAFINALDMVFDDDALYDRLLRKRYTQSATLSLPLAGPVRLWAFQADPFPEGETC